MKKLDLSRTVGVVTPTVDAEVLGVLAAAESTFTGRQVQIIMGSHTQKSVWSALQRLSKQGVVLKEQKGNAGHYSLNRNHLAAPYIIGLAKLKDEFLQRTADLLESWEIRPVFVALFGSAARGEMSLESDLDLFIVRPDQISVDDETWSALESRLVATITEWTGNDARVLEYSESEVRDGLERAERVLLDIQEQSIVLLGERSTLRAPQQRLRKQS